jgi:hypothetical protein
MIGNAVIRRSVRLLAAIQELHKEGFQNLAVYTGMSGSGFHWRLSLLPFENLYIDENGDVTSRPQANWHEAHHSSGETGNQYFGWDDAGDLTARELAKMIKERFPRLIEHCRGTNFKYSGWLTYILGRAEKELLPVMYRDYYQAPNGMISSTQGQEKLVAPPHNKLYRINGRTFTYSKGPHFNSKRDDWHTCYRDIIDKFRGAEISHFPSYPSQNNDTSEHGAYWEGAIYYIDQILGLHRIDEFLRQADNPSKTSERWSSFFAIFDTHGQLVYLKAFFVRYMLVRDADKYQLNSSELKKWKKWLADFEKSHVLQRNFNSRLPNPYFGGNNPLHLGGILESNNQDVGNRLIGY